MALSILLLDPSATTTPAPAELGGGGGYGAFLLESLLALGLVCLLAWVVIRFGLGRLYGARRGAGGDARLLRHVARLPLEPRRSVHIVEAAGRYLVVGSGENGALTTLAELDAAAVEREVAAGEGRAAARRGAFAELLARVRRGARGAGASTAAPAERPGGEDDRDAASKG